jgi:hypothetical protein
MAKVAAELHKHVTMLHQGRSDRGTEAPATFTANSIAEVNNNLLLDHT